MIRPSRWMWVALSCLVVLASSCGQRASETSTSTETSENPSSMAPPSNLTVTNVDLGKSVGADSRVVEKTMVFHPSDPIYASVITSGTAPTATIRTRWTFEDGQVVEESEQVIAPTGDAATEFHISKPEGFPAGKYKLEVFLDGNPVRTVDFEVQKG